MSITQVILSTVFLSITPFGISDLQRDLLQYGFGQPAPPPKRRLGYLSAAPTVSTRKDALSAGPRAHISGVVKGFEAAGFDVSQFIVGDRLAPSIGKNRIQGVLEASPLARYAGDAVRLLMARRNRARAFAELGNSVDWVYERFATMQVLGRRFQWASIPWILETQGLFYYETRTERQNVAFNGLAKAIEIKAYRDCDVLVCISEPLKALLVDECGIDPAKILVVPNAVDLDRFDPAVTVKARPFDGLSLVFVGGLIEWQALDLLLHAMAELRGEGMEIGLIVAGTGAMLPRWQALSAELGLASQVRFVGHVPGDEVADCIAMADLGYAGARSMAIGSMYHSPIKLYEYMAMAKPVLAAAHDDACRLVAGDGAQRDSCDVSRSHETGFLFKPDDREDLKRALRTAYAHRMHLVEMGLRARDVIERAHSWQVRTAGMIRSIETLSGAQAGDDFTSVGAVRLQEDVAG